MTRNRTSPLRVFPRFDPVMWLIAGWCHIEDIIRGRECVICGERTRHMTAHVYINHDPTREK